LKSRLKTPRGLKQTTQKTDEAADFYFVAAPKNAAWIETQLGLWITRSASSESQRPQSAAWIETIG
jgi:hypothetical protein